MNKSIKLTCNNITKLYNTDRDLYNEEFGGEFDGEFDGEFGEEFGED